MEMTRKQFLKDSSGAAAAAAGFLLLGPGLMRLAFGASSPREDLLVCVFLRGACDGLNLVPPIDGEDRPIYEAERPNIKIAASGGGAALKLEGPFGLHPAAKALHELFKSKKLAIVHAAGLTADTRSHFDAQAMMEAGTPGKKGTTSGWLARHLETTPVRASRAQPSFMTAIAAGNLVPGSLQAFNETAVINGLFGFNLAGRKELAGAQRDLLRRMYQGDHWLMKYGRETLEALDAIEGASADTYKPAGGASYPKGDIGNRLMMLAQLIKMDLGLRVATVDMGAWDTHKFQGEGEGGHFGNQVSQLSEALTAFHQDLSGRPVTVIVMTEFGRRVKENANRGTDHGHGGVLLALGEQVNGGKVYGRWPGLKTENLYERADLAVTTDYRQVLSELLTTRLGNSRLDKVFPGFAPGKPLGLFRA